MKAVAGGMKEPKPVPLGGVAGTGETEKIAWTSAAAQQPGQRGMNRPASVTIAPARHDEGTGEDTGPLPARPAHRLQKLIGAVGVPIGKKQFCLRGQGMHDFSAENAVRSPSQVTAPTAMTSGPSAGKGMLPQAVA